MSSLKFNSFLSEGLLRGFNRIVYIQKGILKKKKPKTTKQNKPSYEMHFLHCFPRLHWEIA